MIFAKTIIVDSYFHNRPSLITSTSLVHVQALHRTYFKFSALPISAATRANKTTPLHVGTNYTHNFGFYIKGNDLATNQIVWAAPLRTPITPLYDFILARYYLVQREAKKPSTICTCIFMGLSLTPITNIWNAS